jgi:hypothetical protein
MKLFKLEGSFTEKHVSEGMLSFYKKYVRNKILVMT